MPKAIRKYCWCGSGSFNLEQWEDRKGDVVIVCQRCKSERRVSTPGVSVPKYEVNPEFRKEVADA